MPKKTLETIRKQINVLEREAKRLERKKSPVLRRIVGLVRTNDISIDEIRSAVGGRPRRTAGTRTRKRRPSRKYAVKYKNPKTGERWSGQGRTARWLVAAEKAGRKRSEFLVKKR